MRKFLLSLFLTSAVFFGNAQVVLNEVYSNPNTGKHEFFELYNTDISTTPIDLDCYTVIVYYSKGKNNNDRGFFVIDLPTGQIASKGYYVGASASSINVQSLSNIPANFNWNNPGSTGYLKKYRQNASGTGYSDVTSAEVPSNFNNLFETVHGGGDVAIFLFNNGQYINGFAAGFNTGTTLPAQIANMADLTVAYANPICGTSFTIDWSVQAAKIEYQSGGGSGGTDNGFAREFDGNCGSWVKTSNSPNHTPGKANGSATNTSVGFLSTSERLICSSQIGFQITSTTDLNALPVVVQLYEDNATVGTLDGNDVFVTSQTITSVSATATYFFQPIDPSKSYLIVYKTAFGCLDKVEIPTVATGSLTTTAKDICSANSRIDFTVTGASGSIAPYVFPINVELRYDVDGDGILDADETTIIDQKVITSFSTDIYSFTNPDPTQKVILVYNTAQSCFNKTQTPDPTTGELTTTESYVCNNRLNFSISGGTGDAASYSLPIDVMVYNQADNVLLGSKTITALSGLTDYIDLLPADWNSTTLRVEYKTAFNCFSKTVSGPAKTTTGTITLKGGIPTTTTVYCSIDNVATASDVYPLIITVYEDRNNNGQGDADEPILNTVSLNTAPPANTTYSATLSDTKYKAVAEARSTVGCSQATLLLAPATPLPVRLVSFTAKRDKEKVHLKWKTAMELNNSGFDIQRKVGNGEWKTIAFMFSQANGGNSNSVLSYAYNDVNPTKGVSQYRLRQVDIDTRYTLSEVRSVRGVDQSGKLLVYPNPSTEGKINIVFDEQSGNRNITVSDISGRIVKQYRQITDNSVQIDGLQNGIYTLEITNATTRETVVEKIIIKKR